MRKRDGIQSTEAKTPLLTGHEFWLYLESVARSDLAT